MSEDKLTRREFSAQAVLAMLSGVVVTVSAASCGDSDSGPSAPTTTPTATPDPAPSGVDGTITANHGHVAVVTDAQLTAGDAVTLDITGGAGHPHSVELTADEVQSIANGTQVSKRSSTLMSGGGLYAEVETHSHAVTFN